MLTLSYTCPRCEHEKSILQIVWEDEPNLKTYAGRREVLVRCIHCRQHSVALFFGPHDFTFTGHLTMLGDVAQWDEVTFCGILPATNDHSAPESVPGNVAKAFTDGKAILARGMWTPAAGSFRTSLDRATQVLWSGLEAGEQLPFKLDVRLRKLAEKLAIPKPMMDWADTVRVVGNEMHDVDEISKEDAEDAAHFVETFLTYMFTLPARVARFKARREAE